MLHRRTYLILGSAFIFASLLMLAQFFQVPTGYVVSESTNSSSVFYTSIWFFISGLFLFTVPKFLNNKIKSSKNKN